MKRTAIFFVFVIFMASCDQTRNWTMQSPDGNISVLLELDKQGQLYYQVFLESNEKTITAIEPSAVGIIHEDGNYSKDLVFISENTEAYNESYELVTGKQTEVQYESNQSTFTFKNDQGNTIEIVFRVFNDGLGYRYQFPGESEKEYTIENELTEFNLPDIGTCWSQPYDTISKWTPAYETFYTRSMDIGTNAPENKNGWSFPVTFNTNDIWIMISESNLDGTYPASHLEAECKDGVYRIRFPETEEAFGKHSNKPVFELPWNSPWRVIVVGPTPATIVETMLITNLADPSKIEDTSWIKPGRAAWSWWSDSPSPQYVKEQNRFTDLAVEMGWEYNLIDANWDQMKDGHVTDAIDYAVKNGIGPILWYNSGGNHNQVEEAPRNKMWDPEIRAAEFEKIAGWGVKGVKVDFFQSDKQAIINQYLGILKDAAENKVMCNFHGCTLPRGWNRTWPNMVTLEAVPGGEVYKFGKNYPEYAPWHNTVLPFTRNAVGPMDYTPVMFSDHTYPHLTTYAHELATSVIFESGIIHMADKVEAYLSLPDQAKQFLKEVPSVWDDTRFIDGYPGDFIILARKNGDTWYVAGINGTDDNQKYEFATTFLPEGNYKVNMIADGKTDTVFKFSEIRIQNGESIAVSLLPYGGFAATINVE
ncbi:MAG: glycoside hydrolase family 97 protein [Bacteroidales bacterium]|nr:glycoside hydrolase family 97 protein [Bacteroidales bacterium]